MAKKNRTIPTNKLTKTSLLDNLRRIPNNTTTALTVKSEISCNTWDRKFAKNNDAVSVEIVINNRDIFLFFISR